MGAAAAGQGDERFGEPALQGPGPTLLPDLVPTLVYVTLAPFLEAEDAYEVAVG